MKLLVIGSDRKLFDPGSNVGRRQIEYAKTLEGLHIVVFTLAKLKTKSHQLSINCWIYPTNSRSRFLYWFDAWRLGRKFRRIDMVSAQDPFESGLAAWLVSRSLHTKLHLQIHTDFLSPHFARLNLLNRIRVRLASFLLPRADAVRVVSQRIADSIKAKNLRLKAEPVVQPVFVDLEKLKHTPVKTDLHKKYPQFDMIILMASRLTKEKNIKLGIDAMREVIKRSPDTGLLIVGSGPEEHRLRTRSVGLEANVIFESWTNDLSSYYKTADLFLNTSWYEGYGMTLVEAHDCGCHIISTDVGVAREMGATIVDYNPPSVADAIRRSLQK